MERINLTKYGFIRSKEDDFSDDGNRFTCYRVGKVRVSKIVSHGEVYIAARRDDHKLDYEDYSKLPHYKSMDRLNGVSQSDLTEQDLIDLYNDCLAYDAEYEDAMSKVVWPTIEELAAVRRREVEVRKAELEIVKRAFSLDKFIKLSDYEVKNLHQYMVEMTKVANPIGTDEEWAERVYKTPYSKSYMKNPDYYCQPSYNYKWCMEILTK